MTELYVPFIPVENTNWVYNGRLAVTGSGDVTLAVIPPDGVFLKTLRITGALPDKHSFNVILWRTVKADPLINPRIDQLVNEDIAGTGLAFTQSYDLTAVGPKNVVDNSTYNYSFEISTTSTDPMAISTLGEVAILY